MPVATLPIEGLTYRATVGGTPARSGWSRRSQAREGERGGRNITGGRDEFAPFRTVRFGLRPEAEADGHMCYFMAEDLKADSPWNGRELRV